MLLISKKLQRESEAREAQNKDRDLVLYTPVHLVQA